MNAYKFVIDGTLFAGVERDVLEDYIEVKILSTDTSGFDVSDHLLSQVPKLVLTNITRRVKKSECTAICVLNVLLFVDSSIVFHPGMTNVFAVVGKVDLAGVRSLLPDTELLLASGSLMPFQNAFLLTKNEVVEKVIDNYITVVLI
jgi:hypothetical protein